MKRKLVQQGSSTLMISLPSKWIKSFELKKGDEIDLEEKDRSLLISQNKSEETKIKEKLNIDNLTPLVNRAILSHYIRGTDEIEVTFSNVKEIKDFQKRVINELIGFEIIKQTQNSLLLKDISGTDKQNINELIQRIFLILDSMMEELILALENKQNLEPVIEIDSSINKFSNFCLRILNKYGHTELKKTPQIYAIVSSLEEIGDTCKKLALKITNERVKVTKEDIALLKEIRIFLDMFRKELLNFSREEEVAFARKYEQIKSKIGKNSQIHFYLYQLIEVIIKMNSHLLVISDL